MRRIILLTAMAALLFASGAMSAQADNDTVDAIKARIQTRLDAVAAKPSPRVLVIPIREAIDLSTAVYVEREMERAPEEKIDLVVVDMDTPGGRSDASERICNAFLQNQLPADRRIPVVSFVNTDAYSAGAMISMACDRIYIATNGKIGALTGWIPGPDGMPVTLPEDVQEKFLSAERAQIAALAQQKGYPTSIAVAMVDRSFGLVRCEENGAVQYLNLNGEGLDSWENRKQEMIRRGMTRAEAMSHMTVLLQQGRLLTLTYRLAKDYGLAADVCNTKEDVFKDLGVKAPVLMSAEHNWSEYVFGYLASPAVRGILLIVGLAGIYLEFKSPGLILPAFVGAVFLALFFFSQYFMGLAGYTGILLFLIGLGLVMVELFLIPGFGIPGILGVLLMIAGLFLGMQLPELPDFHNPFSVHLFLVNVVVMSVALVALAVFAVVLAKLLPSMPFLHRLILTSTGPAGELRSSGTLEEQDRLLDGTTGTSLSQLRPAGRAEFGGRVLDVVTRGEFIEGGAAIVVIKVEGNRVVVRKAE